MKTINVTDEMYEFLTNLSNEIKTQDNRSTAKPYFFQVRETKEVPAHEGNGEEVLYSSDHEMELRTDDEKLDFLKEHIESLENTEWEEESRDIDNHTNSYELDLMLGTLGFNKFYVENSHIFSNAFFTSKACDEHIRINGHNLNAPTNYLSHAYRNYEMDMMFKFLESI